MVAILRTGLAITREGFVALALLSLIFLSFGHQQTRTVVAPDGSVISVAATSFCGEGHNGPLGAAREKSCDACRIASGIAQPQPFIISAPVKMPVQCALEIVHVVPPVFDPLGLKRPQRAPPIFV